MVNRNGRRGDRPSPRRQDAAKDVVLIGLGNIGSHAGPLVARTNGIGRITLIDCDDYESKNIHAQDISLSSLGKPKVEVQSRRLRKINATLTVRTIRSRVEDVPLGALRADVILTGLDSRLARQYVNQAAWRLGVPWIDAGVDASGMLARVNVYAPGPGNPCLECAWDGNDYAASALEQRYPCDATDHASTATNAPASLGAVTAGIVAVELQKLLSGDRSHGLVGRQVLVNLRDHTHFVTSFRHNPDCRFDHETWNIERLSQSPSRLTLDRALQLDREDYTSVSSRALRLEGHHFARMQYCPRCNHHHGHAPSLADRIPTKDRRCPECGGAMVVRGFDRIEWLDARALDASDGRRMLSSLGFRPGDIFAVRGPDVVRHYECGGS
ncbi:MAG TPA: hypothetical protein DD670_03725 [Planctomycetaceae bacterium]|nr:hypothetical protein [Planctomycetaceae bacterium]